MNECIRPAVTVTLHFQLVEVIHLSKRVTFQSDMAYSDIHNAFSAKSRAIGVPETLKDVDGVYCYRGRSRERKGLIPKIATSFKVSSSGILK